MALVVEDGTGLSTAESYCSVAFADAHHNARGSAADEWDAVDDKEAALRLATDYIEQTYRSLWAGVRSTATQALDWPRKSVPWEDSPSGVRPSDAIPSELKKACAELALRSASGPLLADLGRETISETVDIISVSYAQGGARQTKFAAVDGWLRSLLSAGGPNSIRIVRS